MMNNFEIILDLKSHDKMEEYLPVLPLGLGFTLNMVCPEVTFGRAYSEGFALCIVHRRRCFFPHHRTLSTLKYHSAVGGT